jgi:plastocyanin
MSKHLTALVCAAGLAVGVAACGGSGSSSSAGSASSSSSVPASPATSSSATPSSASSSTSSAPAPGGKSHQLAVAADSKGSLMFTKKTLTARAGTITFTFTNTSPLAHNLTVQKGTNGAVLGATPTFMGGTKTLTLKLTSGTYTYYCSVPGHRAGGMLGTLTVS